MPYDVVNESENEDTTHMLHDAVTGKPYEDTQKLRLIPCSEEKRSTAHASHTENSVMPYTSTLDGQDPNKLYNWAIAGMIRDEMTNWRGKTARSI